MALTQYQQDVQRLLHDPNAQYFSLTDITRYINQARTQIAAESQAIRVLVSGFVSAVAVVTSGSGYSSSALVGISGTGQGAVLTPTIVGGQITAVAITAAGSGYDNTTTASASDATGTGATFTVTTSGTNLTVVGQEVYTFVSRNAAAKAAWKQTTGNATDGITGILGVFGVSVTWGGNRKPTLQRVTWTDFQAKYRSYSIGLQSYPAIWASFGQGDAGSIYLWPIASSISAMDWDTFCLPVDLADDTTPEALPYPWTSPVKYYAAYLAYSDAQRAEDAEIMNKRYMAQLKLARANAEPPFIPDVYAS